MHHSNMKRCDDDEVIVRQRRLHQVVVVPSSSPPIVVSSSPSIPVAIAGASMDSNSTNISSRRRRKMTILIVTVVISIGYLMILLISSASIRRNNINRNTTTGMTLLRMEFTEQSNQKQQQYRPQPAATIASTIGSRNRTIAAISRMTTPHAATSATPTSKRTSQRIEVRKQHQHQPPPHPPPSIALSSSSLGNTTKGMPTVMAMNEKERKKKGCPTTTTANSNSNGTMTKPLKYKQSTTLPQWMKDYFDWHRQQILDLKECNFDAHKFLILRCSFKERKCGGVADRLKSLPFYIAAAASSQRIFLIRWERPTKLEHFLVPNELNWSVPRWLHDKIANSDSVFNKKNNIIVSEFILGEQLSRFVQYTRYKSVPIIEGLLQDYYGGSSYYYRMHCALDKNCNTFEMEQSIKKQQDYAGWSFYESIFPDLFVVLFTPAPPIARLIQTTMKELFTNNDNNKNNNNNNTDLNSLPGSSSNNNNTITITGTGAYSGCHYRAFYGIENKKDTIDESVLVAKTRNALNCVSQLSIQQQQQQQHGKQPRLPENMEKLQYRPPPIYFASDSLVAIRTVQDVARTENRSIGTFTTTDKNTSNNNNEHDREALHLDKRYQWKSGNVSDFYATFVDLLILANATCISIGVGGFGRFASLISKNTNTDTTTQSCVNRHDNIKNKNNKSNHYCT